MFNLNSLSFRPCLKCLKDFMKNVTFYLLMQPAEVFPSFQQFSDLICSCCKVEKTCVDVLLQIFDN